MRGVTTCTLTLCYSPAGLTNASHIVLPGDCIVGYLAKNRLIAHGSWWSKRFLFLVGSF